MAGLLDFIIKSLFSDQMESLDSSNTPSTGLSKYVHRLVFHRRNERIEKEILMIAPRFSQSGGILYDETNKDWLIISKYPLPERWEERWCKLMIIFPNTYPETPPIGFYLNRRSHLKNGRRDSHFTGQAYHGAPDLQEQGWYWYCVTMGRGYGGWKPSGDYQKPDNLWTFLNMVRESLTNDF